jgi:peptidoglycan/xylan/chitin deacetylase (PgdA/CDA1 family)
MPKWDKLTRIGLASMKAELGPKLPVLMFHHVGPDTGGVHPELTLSPRQFARKVSWLARRGYSAITGDQWIAWCTSGASLPPKPVLLTFDDAYSDIGVYALPTLRRHGFTALVFVISGLVGDNRRWDGRSVMDATSIKFWAGEGIQFGSHTRTHADLRRLAPDELHRELAGSREDLEDLLESPVECIAYPYGWYNSAVRAAAARLYSACFSILEGVNDVSTDRSLLRRTMVKNTDSLLAFQWRLSLGYDPLGRVRARARIRTRFKRLLGWG